MCFVISNNKFNPQSSKKTWLNPRLFSSVSITPAVFVLLATLPVSIGVNAKTKDQPVANPFIASGTYLISLPSETYQRLKGVFTQVYQQTHFDTDLSKSTFIHSNYYDALALPLASSSDKSVNLEVFGQLYDKQSIAYSQMAETLTTHDFQQNYIQTNQNKDDLALGFGLSFAVEKNLKLRTLYSTGQIPGYGDSQFSLGFEMKY